MAKIKQIIAREIIDARGNPTVEARVILSDGSTAVASSPSGISRSTYEAFELRDNDLRRFKGLGVLKAVQIIHEKIAPALIGIEASDQQRIDRTMIELDGTQTKSKLGANATLPVSMAVAKAAAKSSVLPLFLYLRNFIKRENQELKIPSPIFNIINGGLHTENTLDIQEFHVIPATFKTFSDSLQLGVTVYQTTKDVLRRNNLSTLLGDEGGFSPSVDTNEDALSLIVQAVEESNLRLGYDIFLGIDAAANSFYTDQHYKIKDKSMSLTSSELISWYEELVKKYHILYLEDPLSEDDWDGWETVFPKISQYALIVGDDLTATNPFRLQMALYKKSINSIVIKPNQIGTVIEALAVVEIARHSGLKIVVSHRSGETNDDFIADFAVATSADYVKFGAPARGERVAKYNRLLQIDQQLQMIQRQ
jgi:enolase